MTPRVSLQRSRVRPPSPVSLISRSSFAHRATPPLSASSLPDCPSIVALASLSTFATPVASLITAAAVVWKFSRARHSYAYRAGSRINRLANNVVGRIVGQLNASRGSTGFHREHTASALWKKGRRESRGRFIAAVLTESSRIVRCNLCSRRVQTDSLNYFCGSRLKPQLAFRAKKCVRRTQRSLGSVFSG